MTTFSPTRRPAPARIGTATSKPRRGRKVSLAAIEALEGRQMMTSVPTFSCLMNAGPAVASVPTAPMEKSVINGTLDATGAGSIGVSLKAGQILDVTNVVYYQRRDGSWNTQYSSIWVSDPQGKYVDHSDITTNTEETFRAAQSGTYQVHYASTYQRPQDADPNASSPAYLYAAYVRPIGVDTTPDDRLDPNHNAADAAKLSYSDGGLYASTENNGQTLDLTGPTGRAIQLTGNWQTSTARDGTVTFTATSKVGLVTAAGTINLPLSPLGSVVVTTKPNANGTTLFGEVSAVQLAVAGLPLGSLINQVGSQFNFTASLDSFTGGSLNTPGASWGIALGSSLIGTNGKLNDQNAPLDPAVPYLYFTGSTGVSYSYGQANLGAGSSYAVDAVIDPTDPSFYFHVSGLPVVSDFAVGGSLNDLFLYTPQNAITSYAAGGFYGDFLVKGELNIGDLTDNAVPLAVSGSIMFDLDPNHLGAGNAATHYAIDLGRVVTARSRSEAQAASGQLINDMANIRVGTNSQLSLALSAKNGLSLTLPLIQGSDVWDGPTGTAYFRSQTAQPFNGTALNSFIVSPGFAWQGMFNMKNGNFDVSAQGTYTVFGQTLANATVDLSNTGIAVAGDVSFDETLAVGGLVSQAQVTEHVSFNMNASGTGTMSSSGTISGSLNSGGSSIGSYQQSYNYQSGTINVIQQGHNIWDYAQAGLDQAAKNDFNAMYNYWNSFTAAAKKAGQKVTDLFHKLFG